MLFALFKRNKRFKSVVRKAFFGDVFEVVSRIHWNFAKSASQGGVSIKVGSFVPVVLRCSSFSQSAWCLTPQQTHNKGQTNHHVKNPQNEWLASLPEGLLRFVPETDPSRGRIISTLRILTTTVELLPSTSRPPLAILVSPRFRSPSTDDQHGALTNAIEDLQIASEEFYYFGR